MAPNAETSEMRRVSVKRAGIHFGYGVIALLILFSLLAPTLLCAFPAAPLSAADEDCCKHMKSAKDCTEAGMSACCLAVPQTIAAPVPATKKAPAPSLAAIQYAVVSTFTWIETPSLSSLEKQADSSSPPHLILDSIQVLRI